MLADPPGPGRSASNTMTGHRWIVARERGCRVVRREARRVTLAEFEKLLDEGFVEEPTVEEPAGHNEPTSPRRRTIPQRPERSVEVARKRRAAQRAKRLAGVESVQRARRAAEEPGAKPAELAEPKKPKRRKKPKKRSPEPEARRSQSVWTISGGGFESNRRRH
ncbi:MAG: hypothetical protein M3Q30_01745 [Actinomycetota bacterium]|nr:hypothetical protein [Actinomycetota bacterium]